MKAGADLLIVTQPILDSRDILMRITLKEVRQVTCWVRAITGRHESY